MINSRTYYKSAWEIKKIQEELEPTKKDLPKEVISRMSFLERKQVKDHRENKSKINAKREKLRKKRKSKRK